MSDTVELVPSDPFEIPVDVHNIPRNIKRMMAFELRKAGAPYELIAEKLGYANHNTCRNAINKVIETHYTPEAVEEVVNLELARLDHLQLVAWRRAKDGDLKAMDTILKIMERRSKYLGLDQQTETVETINQTAIFIGGSESEYIDKLREAQKYADTRALAGSSEGDAD